MRGWHKGELKQRGQVLLSVADVSLQWLRCTRVGSGARAGPQARGCVECMALVSLSKCATNAPLCSLPLLPPCVQRSVTAPPIHCIKRFLVQAL